jgi:DNA-binding NarL/FixJ family response regulator
LGAVFNRSVVVVEDEDFLRSLIADSLERAGFEVTSAANAADAKRALKSVDPDAVVLDIDLGRGPTGFDIADQIRKESKEIAIVFLTGLPDPRFAGREMKSVGKNEAYLSKHLLSDSKIIVDALNAVLLESGIEEFRHHELEERAMAALSNTQIQVLQLLAEGKTNQQIADARGRSLAATESSITRTLEALNIPVNSDVNVRVTAARRYLEVVRPRSSSAE